MALKVASVDCWTRYERLSSSNCESRICIMVRVIPISILTVLMTCIHAIDSTNVIGGCNCEISGDSVTNALRNCLPEAVKAVDKSVEKVEKLNLRSLGSRLVSNGQDDSDVSVPTCPSLCLVLTRYISNFFKKRR